MVVICRVATPMMMWLLLILMIIRVMMIIVMRIMVMPIMVMMILIMTMSMMVAIAMPTTTTAHFSIFLRLSDGRSLPNLLDLGMTKRAELNF